MHSFYRSGVRCMAREMSQINKNLQKDAVGEISVDDRNI